MKSKFYAVVGSGISGIYTDWNKVSTLIQGVSNRQKKFGSIDDAVMFLCENGLDENQAEYAKAHLDESLPSEPAGIVKEIPNSTNKAEKDKSLNDVEYPPEEELEFLKRVNIKVENEPDERKAGIKWLDDFVLKSDACKADISDVIKKYDEDGRCANEIFDTHSDVDAVAFVDGSGEKDKDGNGGDISLGIVFIDIKNKDISGYRRHISRGDDLQWLLKGSNDSAEIVAAGWAMQICSDLNFKSLRIYQDNVRPMNYFLNNFHKVTNIPGEWYINSSIRQLENGLDIRFIYVPAHETKKGYGNIKCGISRISIDTAKKYNAISDALASYKNQALFISV